MMRYGTRVFCLAALFYGSGALAQHSFSYDQRIRSPGTTVTINGAPFKIVTVPVIEVGTEQRYALTYAAQQNSSGFLSGSGASFLHQGDIPTNPNFPLIDLTISGFPAKLSLTDTLTFRSNSNGAGGRTFRAARNTGFLVVYVDIGDTVVSILVLGIGASSSVIHDIDVGPDLNFAQYATWGEYIDDPAILAGVDKWIDYIRLVPL